MAKMSQPNTGLQRGENSILNAEQSIQAIYDSANEAEATQRIEISRSLLDNLQQSGIITATTENHQRFLAMVTKIEKRKVSYNGARISKT
jgi:hypothetical protein